MPPIRAPTPLPLLLAHTSPSHDLISSTKSSSKRPKERTPHKSCNSKYSRTFLEYLTPLLDSELRFTLPLDLSIRLPHGPQKPFSTVIMADRVKRWSAVHAEAKALIPQEDIKETSFWVAIIHHMTDANKPLKSDAVIWVKAAKVSTLTSTSCTLD